jgi:hypothetical protein
MADITGRVQKKAGELLEAGERIIAALLVEPKGAYGVGSFAIAALPRTSMRILADRSVRLGAEEGGLAATFPRGSCAIAATDRRVIVIPSNGVGFKEIAAAYELADLSVTDNSSKGLGRRLTLTFIDETTLVVDAQRGQPFTEFAATLTSPLAT